MASRSRELRHRSSALCALAMIMLSLSGPLQAAKRDGLEVCNNNAYNTLKLAVVHYSGNALYRSWTSLGWFTIKPKQCSLVITGSNMVNNNFYLSVLSIRTDGKAIIYTPPETPVEEAFCVQALDTSRGEFTLRRSSLGELRNCPAGYSLQLFNIYVQSKEFTRYTLNLD